jgi:hypothetical protein
MEPSGRNRWQPVASRTAARTAEMGENRCPPVATGCLRCSMVRRGRRFESARGLCKGPANRRFLFHEYLHDLQRAVGMEPFMEPSGSERALEESEKSTHSPGGHAGRSDKTRTQCQPNEAASAWRLLVVASSRRVVAIPGSQRVAEAIRVQAVVERAPVSAARLNPKRSCKQAVGVACPGVPLTPSFAREVVIRDSGFNSVNRAAWAEVTVAVAVRGLPSRSAESACRSMH